MKKIVFILLIAIILTSFISSKHTQTIYESDTLKIEQVTKNVFKHISYLETKDYGKVPCNGMIYFNENEAIIFDTPTNSEASVELIKWIGEKTIKAVIITHFHIDCLGGLDQFHSEKITSYANHLTIQLAKENNQALPKNGFNKRLDLKIGNEVVVAEHFGEGHTKDNIVGYIPSEKVMFGGCLVKALNYSKGNIEDANTTAWPKTIENIKQKLPNVETIIPGHGNNGGAELLEYTIRIFKEN